MTYDIDKFHIVVAQDCYEIKKEKPSNLLAKGSTWSRYKQSNTVKILIAPPQDVTAFLSDSWGGWVSDKHIIILTTVTYCIRQIIREGKLSQFSRIWLIANVLPLKIFLEYQLCPLTKQSMVPSGLKFSTTKVFPTY